MLTVYGIKSCDTCRRARKFLESRGIEFRFHDLREDGLDIQMKSLTWREIPDADRNDMTKDRAFASMLDQPTLVKRPVLEHPSFFAVGFSEKRFTDFLEKTG